MNRSRTPAPRPLLHALWLAVLLGWGVSMVLVMLVFGVHQGAENARVVQDTRAWVNRWTLPLSALPVGPIGACGQGPRAVCAVVVVPVPEGGDALIRAWPRDNWAKAWLPLSSWKVAHDAALHARDSGYGRRVLAAGSEGVSRVPDPHETRRTNAQPGWRLSMIVGPTDPFPPASVEAGSAPMVSQRPYGPVVRFNDGMELPARQENGRWYVLAQGPMDQAQRFAASLMGHVDPGISPNPFTGDVARSGPTAPSVAAASPADAWPSSVETSTEPATRRPVQAARTDRDNDLRATERNGLRTPRPNLDEGDDPSMAGSTPAAARAMPLPHERTRDRDQLRRLPRNERPMLDLDETNGS